MAENKRESIEGNGRKSEDFVKMADVVGDLGIRTDEGCGNSACYCTGVCRGKADTGPYEYSGGDNEVRTAEDDDKLSDISIRVTADVAEAIKGFKALQRELRETTKAAREYEDVIESIDGRSVGELVNSRDNDVYNRDNLRFKAGEGIYEGIGFIIDDSTGKPLTMFDYSGIPTKQLHEELAKREGVEFREVTDSFGRTWVNVHSESEHTGSVGTLISAEGPVKILVIKD